MISNENIHLRAERGKIIYRFHARDLNLIMGLAAPGISKTTQEIDEWEELSSSTDHDKSINSINHA